jgi:RND family efflux transporter MFP subunit
MVNEKPSLDALRIDRGTESSGSRRRAWLTAAVVALVALAGIGWAVARPRAVPVKTAVARESKSPAAAGTVLNASGYVTARRQATVSSKVTGKVTAVLVEEGMAVKEGQVLARLDEASIRTQLALAEAQLASAQRALAETEVRLKEAQVNRRRLRELHAQGVASQSDLDAVEANANSLAARLELGRQDVAVAERQLGVRRQDMTDTVIRAPFSGVAISKDAQPGEMISPVSAGGGFTRTGICTLVDMSSLEIEVDVNESYINRVKGGQPAQATLDAYPDWQIPATVIAIVPAADRQKATVKVRLAFDKLDPKILPDMGVKVAFLNGEEKTAAAPAKPAVVVPRAAVRKDGDSQVVFVVHDDRAERRAVRISDVPGDEVAVTSGLNGGEQVVVEGPVDLKDGARVKVS